MPNEPDYEQIMDDREERRGEAWLHRMDARYGRIEDHLTQVCPNHQEPEPCTTCRSYINAGL